MDVTNRFVLDFARRFALRHPAAAMLDFGCGSGALVQAARAAGLAMVGADVFYSGAQDRVRAEQTGLLGSAIFECRDGCLPFPAASFDLVTDNQVLEHVPDLDATLGELHRVMKPGGTLLSLFPSRDVLREGHIGIPLAHRFRKDSRARFLYTWALRSLGLGTWKDQAPTRRQWAADKLRWIDTYTFYRSRREIRRAFDVYFHSELREPDYIRYRLRDVAWRAPLARLLDLPLASAAASAVFRKLAFLVIVSRTSGADPLVCAGPPGPALRLKNQVPCIGRKPDQGVRRGPGGPPHSLSGLGVRGLARAARAPGREAAR